MLTKTQSRIEPVISARVRPGHPLARGLAGGWLLNEGAGGVAHDATGYGHDGNFSGGPVWSPGPFGRAVDFDGTDDWISMGDCLDPGTDDVTMLVLVRYNAAHQPDSISGQYYGAIAGKGTLDASGKGCGLYVNGNNGVSWQVRNGATSFVVPSDSALNDGQWHLAVGICDRDNSTGMRLYVDGVRQGATANATALNGIDINGSRAFAIGSRQQESTGTWNGDFLGSVAMVWVWKRVLMEAEIHDLQRDPFGLFAPTGMIAALGARMGSVVQCAGSAQAAAHLSATLRVTRNLTGGSNASASVGAALTTASFGSLSGRVSGRSLLRASLCTTVSQAAFEGAPQVEQHWQAEALFNGMTYTAFQLGTSLTQGWFWVRRRGCTAVYRSSEITKVDLGRILYVAEPDAREIPLPPYLSHAAGSTHCYLVRRFNSCGDQDKTITAAAVLRIGPDGQRAAARPNAAIGLKSEQTDGTCLRLVWFYCPLDQGIGPGQFNIYRDGTGEIDPANPVGVVQYQGRRFYCYLSDALLDGRHTFIVKAQSEEGKEGMSPAPLVRQVVTSSPEPAVILAVESF